MKLQRLLYEKYFESWQGLERCKIKAKSKTADALKYSERRQRYQNTLPSFSPFVPFQYHKVIVALGEGR